MAFSLDDTQQIVRYYQQGLSYIGVDDAQAVHWTGKHAQEVRYQALTQVGDLSQAAVLDVGCGIGDMYQFMQRLYPSVQYYGVDIVPEFVTIAQQRYPDAHFFSGSIGAVANMKFDYCLASGVFTYKIDDFKFKYFELIEQMYERALEGIAFNMLEEGSFDNPFYALYSKDQVLTYFSNLTDKIYLVDDYTDDDFTIYMYH